MDLEGFGPRGCGPAFGPISEVELLDWAILGVLGLGSDPFQPIGLGLGLSQRLFEWI